MAFPSTYLTTQDAVLQRLRLTATADRTRVKDWINQAYYDANVRTEALQKRATSTLTAGSAIYTIPDALIKFKYVAIRGSGQSEYGPPLKEVTVDDLIRWRQSNGGVSAFTGTPSHYATVGLKQFEVWPAPAAADTMLSYYVYAPTALSLDADVAVFGEPWNTKLLEYGALLEASDYMKVPNLDDYRQWYDVWIGRFIAFINQRGGATVRQLQLVSDKPYLPADRSVDLGD